MEENILDMFKQRNQLANGEKYNFHHVQTIGNIIELQFESDVNVSLLLKDMSIFSLIQVFSGGALFNVFKNFITLYNKDLDNNTIYLSCDGSVYDPETSGSIWPDPMPEPEIPEPTLEEIKSQKINEILESCNFNITHGVYMEVNGEQKLFSYKTEDQSNLLNAVQLAIATQMSMPYHADGCTCRLFTPEEITTLYIKEMTNLTHHQTYTNQLKLYIKTLETKEEVNAVLYGNELTGEYLDTYNMIMAQSQLVVQKYLESLTGTVTDEKKDEDVDTDKSANETVDENANNAESSDSKG